jgi:hypothetical protein
MAKGGNSNGNTLPQGNILAVAFTDLNGNGQFDPNKDALIAAVVDTNHDKIIDVGDTVQFGTYPLNVDGTGGRGTFTQASMAITSVDTHDSISLYVGGAQGEVFFVNDPTGQGGAPNESFGTQPYLGGPVYLYIQDYTPAISSDHVDNAFAPLGPGAPDTNVNVGLDQPGNQPFLDVFIA